MIIVSPTSHWFKSALSDCSSSLVVSSPYVGAYFSDAVTKLPKRISVTLLTRTLIADFASGASDLEAVCELANRSGGVLSLSSLHAKVYVIDRDRALVTSANATFSGMHRNRECGLEVKSAAEVRALIKLVLSGFGVSPRPMLWTLGDLKELREPVTVLRAALPKVNKQRGEIVEVVPRVELSRRQLSKLIESFSGWLRLTLEGVSRIRSDTFTMDEVWSVCAPLARQRFPNNHHPREKLRQQMQRLRDLGFVLFLGKGYYAQNAQVR